MAGGSCSYRFILIYLPIYYIYIYMFTEFEWEFFFISMLFFFVRLFCLRVFVLTDWVGGGGAFGDDQAGRLLPIDVDNGSRSNPPRRSSQARAGSVRHGPRLRLPNVHGGGCGGRGRRRSRRRGVAHARVHA